LEKFGPLLRKLWDPWPECLRQWADLLLVTFIIYQLLLICRGTQAWRLLVGIVLFFILVGLSNVWELQTLSMLLDKAMLLGPVALVILFLPQLRAAIEKVPNLFDFSASKTDFAALEEIIAAVVEFARHHTGALIVLDTQRGMDEIVATGTRLDATVSQALLGSIFYEQNPLHDGAVIVRGDKIVAAACQLPLSVNARLDRAVHMRHRAAVGATEVFDCVGVIVSEERGSISVAYQGRLIRVADAVALRAEIKNVLRQDEKPPREPKGPRFRVRRKHAKPEKEEALLKR
jgi:diadenylate cyclase